MGALIEIHFTEPDLSVTYYNKQKYTDLILAMQLVYNQLIICDSQKIFLRMP